MLENPVVVSVVMLVIALVLAKFARMFGEWLADHEAERKYRR